ncbi:MAG: carbohydrate-binding protein [Herbinix sp.]|nr:carbohydrate-binding protein [Herbinix sp.]
MAELKLKIIAVDSKTVSENHGEKEVHLVYTREYCPGDKIIFECSQKPCYVWMQLDDALGKSLVYVTDDVIYEIPFGEKRINLSPKAFYGDKHLLSVKLASEYEVKAYRNLALNVYDQHGKVTCYPHASANVETRGEAVFAAKNAIDGITVNNSHGEWPYQSWGINRQDDAAMKIEFGRLVEVDKVVLYTRADFPHDNWWKSVTLTFSNGDILEVELEKSSLPHDIRFEDKQIEWIELSRLIKSEDPSPFPALSQMEVYGREL